MAAAVFNPSISRFNKRHLKSDPYRLQDWRKNFDILYQMACFIEKLIEQVLRAGQVSRFGRKLIIELGVVLVPRPLPT